MTAIFDPSAGEHFRGRKITVTPHAIRRAVDHFGVKQEAAALYVVNRVLKSTLVDSNVLSDDGNPGRLFAHQGVAYVIAPDSDTVITLYPQTLAPEELRESVEKTLIRELRKAQRKEAAEIKRLSIAKAELAVERAEAELRKLKTNSKRVFEKLTDRIAEIDVEITGINESIRRVTREKTTFAKGVCAFVT